MGKVVRIALVGDFDPAVITHRAIPQALQVSAGRLGVEVTSTWVHRATIGLSSAEGLSEYAAVWCDPASPSASMNWALLRIRSARESPRPFLGMRRAFRPAHGGNFISARTFWDRGSERRPSKIGSKLK
jgi:CTP synthase (UTP-ammonia lyase)